MPGSGGVDFRADAAEVEDASSTEDEARPSVEVTEDDEVSVVRRRVPEGALRTGLIVGVLTLAVAVPIFVALGVLHQPHWLPLSDVAQIELRVRDVGFDHPPLVGLGGRLQGYGEVGSHPGPLSFFALAPVYRLLGADGFALQVSSAALSLTAAALAIWIGYRRGGWRFAVAVAATVVFLFRGYEAWRLVEAWNPHLPIAWWFVFLLAVWSILCGDLPMLPVAVFAGTYCAQTHIPYAGLVVGLGLLTAVGLGVRWLAVRKEGGDEARRIARWSAVALGLLALFWVPPLVDQIIHDPGNLAIIFDNFRHPYDEPEAFSARIQQWFTHLDVRRLIETTGSGLSAPSSRLPGTLLLVALAATAVVAWRRRDAALIRLHVVVGAGLALGLVAITRIFGPLWPYLMLWAWGTTALALLAIVWTVVAAPPRPDAGSSGGAVFMSGLRWPQPTVAGLGIVTVVLATMFSVDAAHSEMPEGDYQSLTLLELVETAEPILDRDPARCGDDCRYLVTWTDPFYIAAQGYGLYAELERQGYDIGAMPYEVEGVRSHRLRVPEDADATIHLAVGGEAIEQARSRPGSRELAYADPNTPAEQASYQELRQDLVAQLKTEGYDELAAQAEAEPYRTITADPDMSRDLVFMLYSANGYRKPSALFLILPQD